MPIQTHFIFLDFVLRKSAFSAGNKCGNIFSGMLPD
jgi:hypothetical protein